VREKETRDERRETRDESGEWRVPVGERREVCECVSVCVRRKLSDKAQ
jgi:hypothetical protein